MVMPISHFSQQTRIRRTRSLPYEGEILVRRDQKVAAMDTVGNCFIPGRHELIDLYQSLGVSRKVPIEVITDRSAGETLQKGDILAKSGKVIKKIVRAPSDCYIESIEDGKVLLELLNPPLELKAGMDGIIREVNPNWSVVVESFGCLLQGVWGNGRVSSGLLVNTVKPDVEEFNLGSVDVTMRGAIVAGSYCCRQEALEAAVDFSLRGLILSSMSSSLVGYALKMEVPIILLEGFGSIPLNPIALNLLNQYDRHNACLNACEWDVFNGSRPEVVIPLPGTGNDAREGGHVRQGSRVRVKVPPYTGAVGIVTQIRDGDTTMHSGLRGLCAEVKFDRLPANSFPVSNLDILE
jgi:hypothetical protein